MPIRPELRKYYGAEHRRNRLILIDIAGGKCSRCGCEHKMLNVAHVHHDPREASLVAVWCPSCHARHDAPHSYAVRRRTRAKRAGQLWLLPEIEFAPFPAWMVPTRVFTRAQSAIAFEAAV